MKRAVVDQSGIKTILFGLITALFFGLAIRSQITHRKVNNFVHRKIEQTVSLNKKYNLNIEFRNAELKLSDWGLPWPLLVIEDLKISSNNLNCSDNQIYIESIQIPLSWSFVIPSKFKSALFIESARVSQAEIRINDIMSCIDQGEKKSVQAKPIFIERTVSGSDSDSSNSLERNFNLYFEKIKIIDRHNFNLPVLFQAAQTKFNLKNNQLQKVDFNSQVFLFKDLARGIYQVRSDLNIEYSLEKDNKIQMRLSLLGQLIDKPFELKLDYDDILKKIKISHVMSDLSVKTIVGLISDMSSNSDLNKNLKKQFEGLARLSFSNEGSGEYNITKRDLDFYKFKNILLSTDDSTVTIDELDIKSIKPFSFSAFEINLNQFDLEKIKQAAFFAPVQKSINNFGQLSGVIEVDADRNVSAIGTLSNLEFIFSNRGRRAYQKINEVLFKFEDHKLFMNGFVFDQEKATGQLEYEFVKADSNHRLRLDLSNIKLNENIYNIFSFNQEKPTKADLSIQIDHNLVKAKLKFDQLAAKEFDLKQADLMFEAKYDEKVSKLYNSMLDLQIRNLKITKDETIKNAPSYYDVLNLLEKDSEYIPMDFYFNNVHGKYVIKNHDAYALNINATYMSKIENAKISLNIDSEYSDAAYANLKLKYANGKKIDITEFNADLNKFIFNVKK